MLFRFLLGLLDGFGEAASSEEDHALFNHSRRSSAFRPGGFAAATRTINRLNAVPRNPHCFELLSAEPGGAFNLFNDTGFAGQFVKGVQALEFFLAEGEINVFGQVVGYALLGDAGAWRPFAC